MSQEIEIEFKNLILKEEATKIRNTYPFPESSIEQTNFYFDTPDFALKDHHAALRIREKEGSFSLTLKETINKGILETHDILSKQEVEFWKHNQPISKPNVIKQLNKMNVDVNKLIYFGYLTTKRTEYHKKQLIYVLDESYYNGHFDYELEIEAPTYEKGVHAFNNLLDKLSIPKRKTPNKIQRFFSTLNYLE